MRLAILLLIGAACGAQQISVSGEVQGIHDPSSIVKDGNTWYIFSTKTDPKQNGELPIHCSNDLQVWSACGFVLHEKPKWITEASPATKELWAPDISYFNGAWHLYYAYSAFGVNTSGIALLTNRTLDQHSPDYRWVDEGLVLKSVKTDPYNAIDPNFALDAKGNPWLSFGSFWTGIQIVRLDSKSGKRDSHDSRIYALASRRKPENPPAQKIDPEHPDVPPDWQAIEAPFIVRHGGHYYLFVSWDLCCRGVKSDYKVVVGRSREITGPYVDAKGQPMLTGGGTLVVSNGEGFNAAGGESVAEIQGKELLVFHAYDDKTGAPSLKIETLDWSSGWPTVHHGSTTKLR